MCPWNSPGKNTGAGCHALLQGIFLTQGLNLESLMSPALTVGFFITSTTWKALTKLDSILKSRGITLPTKVLLVKAMVFPVVMYGCELDHKESWVPKNWCFWTVVMEKTLESPLDSKEMQPVHPKGNQPWIFTGRTDAKAETPILWLHDAKSWFIRKDPDAGKDWNQEEKWMTEDKMVGWHHQLNGNEFKQVPGDAEGQKGLVCWSQ